MGKTRSPTSAYLIAPFLILGVITLYYSRHQPFPEISGRFAVVLIIIGVILWISTTAPRPTGESVPGIVAAFIGGVAVVIGVIHMTVLRNDVVVAPFGGYCSAWGLSVSWVIDGRRWVRRSR